MKPIAPALLACALLSSGCQATPRTETLPDPRVPHRLADEAEVLIWVRRPDNTLAKERVRVGPGWWVASSRVVDP